MSDGKSRNGLSIFLGIVGAVLGFVGALAIAPYNRMDPIASGMLAVLFFGPLGAIAGAFIGAKLGMLGRGAPEAAPPLEPAQANAQISPAPGARSEEIAPASVASNGLKALGIVALLAALGIGGYALHALSTATPWLNPNAANPVLQFEIRLPAGAAMPGPREVSAELQTPHNRMPAEMKPNLYRQDGDRAVIVGEVDLAFRTANRQIEVKIAGRPDRTYYLTLLDKAPHTAALGEWQAKVDGSEIRYRARWPGKE